jgi:hypothetical protein
MTSSVWVQKLCHPRMQRLTCLWIISLFIWGGMGLFALYTVWLVHGTNTYYAHLRNEEQMRMVSYAVTVFQSSCPPVSLEAYRNCHAWVDECQAIPFESTLRGIHQGMETDAIRRALLGMPYTTTFAQTPYDSLERCAEWWHGMSMHCVAHSLLLHRSQVFPTTLLVSVCLVFLLFYICFPHQLHRRLHSQWSRKLLGDKKREADTMTVGEFGEDVHNIRLQTRPSRATSRIGATAESGTAAYQRW